MKTLITSLVAVLLASPLWAQVENVNGQAPKVETANGWLITWAIVGIFAVGILVIAFKTPKRTQQSSV